MKRESRLQSARLRHENPPSIAAENSHFSCHRDARPPARISPTKYEFAMMPSDTTQQNAMNNSTAAVFGVGITCADANEDANNVKKTTSAALFVARCLQYVRSIGNYSVRSSEFGSG
jgi:hypothetical protein